MHIQKNGIAEVHDTFDRPLKLPTLSWMQIQKNGIAEVYDTFTEFVL
jgi:hypothetical protein